MGGHPTDPPVIIVTVPAQRTSERAYVLDTVLADWLGLDIAVRTGPEGAVVLRVAGDPEGREVVVPDVFLATSDDDWLTERSLPPRPLARVGTLGQGDPGWLGLPVETPILYPDATFPAALDTGSLRLGFDVFGAVFFLLTRFEELVVTARDRHGRFPSGASIAVQEGFLERPLADDYVEALWRAMRRQWPTLSRRETSFRVWLTHDVDLPWATWRTSAAGVARSTLGDVVRRRDPGLAWRRMRAFADSRRGIFQRDPYNTYDELMSTSERHGTRSTFYLLAGPAPGELDFTYGIEDPPLEPLLREIHERGHRIGLHASYLSLGQPDRTRQEFRALHSRCERSGIEQEEWGVRQHYLRFATPSTWRHQADAGLDHDSTVGYAERVGFRSGTCREHRVFDIVDRRTLPIRERPLIIMDVTLLQYMGLDMAAAADKARELVGICRRHQGDAVILVHNNSLADFRLHYAELIEHLLGP